MMQLLTIFLMAYTSVLALDPTTVQLDIVFPRNNTAYKPVYPFPIILASHNMAVIDQFPFDFHWGLTYNTSAGNEIVELTEAWQFSREYILQGDKLDGNSQSPSPLLLMTTSGMFGKTEARPGIYLLSVSFGIQRTACSVFNNRADLRDTYIKSMIYLNITGLGQTPDILSAGDCADVLGGFGVPASFKDYERPCPVFARPNPPRESCATKVNASIASKVTQAMLSTLGCEPSQYSWPNTTFRNRGCVWDRKGNDATAKELFKVSSIALFSGILGACLLFL
jgi:hypothetical protein